MGDTKTHSRLPWRFVNEPSDYGAKGATHGFLEDDDEFHVAVMISDVPDAPANAALIVHAVNSLASHEARIAELEGALREARQEIDHLSDVANVNSDAVLARIDRALHTEGE